MATSVKVDDDQKKLDLTLYTFYTNSTLQKQLQFFNKPPPFSLFSLYPPLPFSIFSRSFLFSLITWLSNSFPFLTLLHSYMPSDAKNKRVLHKGCKEF